MQCTQQQWAVVYVYTRIRGCIRWTIITVKSIFSFHLTVYVHGEVIRGRWRRCTGRICKEKRKSCFDYSLYKHRNLISSPLAWNKFSNCQLFFFFRCRVVIRTLDFAKTHGEKSTIHQSFPNCTLNGGLCSLAGSRTSAFYILKLCASWE